MKSIIAVIFFIIIVMLAISAIDDLEYNTELVEPTPLIQER